MELDEVLRAVVRLLSDASAVHACFVYLVDDSGDKLILKAASEPYGECVGRIALERGEGLAWWVAERKEPAFIRENALADPRVETAEVTVRKPHVALPQPVTEASVTVVRRRGA